MKIILKYILGLGILLTSSFLHAMHAPSPTDEETRIAALKRIRTTMIFAATHPGEELTPYDRLSIKGNNRSLYDWEKTITQNTSPTELSRFPSLENIGNLFGNPESIYQFINQYQDQLGNDTLWNKELRQQWQEFKENYLLSILKDLDDSTTLDTKGEKRTTYTVRQIRDRILNSKIDEDDNFIYSAIDYVNRKFPNIKKGESFQRFLIELKEMAEKCIHEYNPAVLLPSPPAPPAEEAPIPQAPHAHAPHALVVSPSPLATPAEAAAEAPGYDKTPQPGLSPKRRYSMIAALATITGAGIVAARAKLTRYIHSIKMPNKQTFNNARISATAAVQKHPYIAALVSAALIGSTASATAGYRKATKKPN